MTGSQPRPQTWADVYTLRAQRFDDPLDICEFYAGEERFSDELLTEVSESVAGFLRLQPDDRVLEVGCGCGVLMSRLLERAREFVGVDMSEGVLEVAKTRLPTVQFHQAPATALPFDDNSFDKCYCHLAIHYFGDYAMVRQALREMGRVTKPGARLMIGQVPNAELESEYQALRRSRTFQREQPVSHDLRWQWFPPSFFTELRSEFQTVNIHVTERPLEPASRFRFDVEIVV